MQRFLCILHEYNCNFEHCKKYFTEKTQLNQYIKRIHQESKSLKFEVILNQNESLKHHLEGVHEKSSLFDWNQCDASFSQNKSLKDHEKYGHRK